MRERGIGAGRLSTAAQARLARSSTSVPAPMPDLDDLAAVAQWRNACNATWGEDDLADGVVHDRREIGGVSCLTAGNPARPTLVYLHGGGYVLGSAGVAKPITTTLATELHVVSVDYRLAPEHPFPAAVDDAIAVVAALTGAGAPVAIGGDSAGAGIALAAALALQLRPAAIELGALVLLSPHLDHRDRSARRGPDARALELMSRAYRGSVPADDPRVSPLNAGPADLARLPPLLLQTGTDDGLHRQALALARRVRAARRDADVTLDVWLGLWHAWHYHPELPEAQAALGDAAHFVARRLAAHGPAGEGVLQTDSAFGPRPAPVDSLPGVSRPAP